MIPSRSLSLLVGLLILFCFSNALAADELLVAVTNAFECSDDLGCGPPDFGDVTLATFLHVDLDRKVITLLAPPVRRGETTPIGQVQEAPDGWLLSGIQNERSWSMVITRDGHMTLSLTMDGTTWTAFGNVMPVDRVRP